MGRTGQRRKGHRLVGWTRGGDANVLNTCPGMLRGDVDQGLQAHFPLAWTHGYGAVSLQGLDILEAFPNTVHYVFGGYVLAKANELGLFFAHRGQPGDVVGGVPAFLCNSGQVPLQCVLVTAVTIPAIQSGGGFITGNGALQQ